MRISESRLRRIIKEELESETKSMTTEERSKVKLRKRLEQIYNELNVGTMNEPDSVKIQKIRDIILDLIVTFENSLK